MKDVKELEKNLAKQLDEIKQSIELSDTLNKSNTQKRVVEPLFNVLDWPMTVPSESASVEFDYSVEEQYVDYALIVNGEEHLFVLSDEFEGSLPSELVVETVLEDGRFDWGVISNGYEYKVYRLVSGDLELIERFTLDNIVSHSEFLTYLTLDSLISGRTQDELEEYDLVVQDLQTVQDLKSDLSRELSDSMNSLDEDVVDSKVDEFIMSLENETSTDQFFTVENSESDDSEIEYDDPDLRFDDDEQNNISTDSEDESSQVEDTSDESDENLEEDSSSDSSEASSEDSAEDSKDSDEPEKTNQSLGSRLFSIVTAIF